MVRYLRKNKGITLVALVVTIIVLLLLAGIAIASLGGENGLFSKVKLGKKAYEISEAKEKIELGISTLQIEQEEKGESLKKEDLPKINNEDIDVRDTTNFPVGVLYGNYKFEVDENFKVKYVGEADGTIVTYTTDPEGYTNKDEVKILIRISNPKGIKSVQKPGETDKLLAQGKTTVGIDYKVTKNGSYVFTIVDMEDNEITKDIYIDLIDKVEPLDFTIQAIKEDKKIVISGTAEDGEATEESTKSGIDHYEYYFVDSNKNEKKYTTNEIPTDELVGTYDIYAIAYDRAGNSKKSNTVKISIMGKTSSISTGSFHTLLLDSNGGLWVFGDNSFGQLGDGTTTDRTSPVQIKDDTKFIQVSAGSSHSLAIDSEGKLWAWGYNYYGQLGDGTTTNRTKPVQIKSGTKFIQISARGYHSLAIDSEGSLWSWGDNDRGQLGDGTTTQRRSPVPIKSGTKFKQISAGYYHSLAIDNEGNLWSWGDNEYGQIGDATREKRTSPIQIKKGTKFDEISAGYYYSIAIDSQENLWSWGQNNDGQLGDETTTDRISPVQIKSEIKFTQISAGYRHSIAIDSEGNLWAWGNNDSGQLGNGTTTNIIIPVQIMVNTNFIQMSGGEQHILAIDSEGKLYGVGDAYYIGDTSLLMLEPEIIN